MSLRLIKRCALCNDIIDDEQDFTKGDDPELCELCNEVATRD